MDDVPRHKIRKIIVEGIDCSGKSTVVERLKNVLRWDSRSLHHKKGNQFYRYLKEYADAEHIVFDRSHFSEEAYSRLWRGGTPFTDDELDILNRLAARDSIIIFACPDISTIMRRYRSRQFQQQIRLDELNDARNLFLMALNKIDFIHYRSKTYEELERLVKKVTRMVKEHETICNTH